MPTEYNDEVGQFVWQFYDYVDQAVPHSGSFLNIHIQRPGDESDELIVRLTDNQGNDPEYALALRTITE